jgi:hypothetical protein
MRKKGGVSKVMDNLWNRKSGYFATSANSNFVSMEEVTSSLGRLFYTSPTVNKRKDHGIDLLFGEVSHIFCN